MIRIRKSIKIKDMYVDIDFTCSLACLTFILTHVVEVVVVIIRRIYNDLNAKICK